MSASHNLLAYGVDETGYETYRIKVRNVKTGEEMPIDVLEGTTGSVSWNGDSQLFYTTMDDAHRPNKVWRHNIGTPQSEDECLLSEDDELYNIGFGKKRQRQLPYSRKRIHGNERNLAPRFEKVSERDTATRGEKA